MPCPGHSEETGLVLCAKCQAPGCPDCLELVDGSYFCASCLLEELEQVETDDARQRAHAELRDSILEAKGRNRKNWILTCIASLFVVPSIFAMVMSDPGIPQSVRPIAAPLLSLGSAYLIWAALWGIPAAWRWWKGVLRNGSFIIFSSPVGWMILAATFLTIPLYFGYMYGVFGGAIYEYRKNRKIALAAHL